jgi:pimeloyl-ACP methyl ester carboxylesterase
VDAVSPLARTGPVTIYCEDAGNGDPVILLHGHGADHRVWDDQAEALIAARHRVIRPDLRGHGRSEAPATGYQYTDYVTDLIALIGHLGVGYVDLVGHSLGGGIGLLYALQDRARLSSLTLVASTLPGYTYSDDFASFSLALRDAVRQNGPRAAMEQVFLPHPMFDGIRRQKDRFDKLRSIVFDFRAPDYLSAEEDVPPPPVIDRLSAIRVPTLVVIGENDIEDFRLIADILTENIPNAEKVVIPGAGHMLPMEQPEALNRILVDFLKRVRR